MKNLNQLTTDYKACKKKIAAKKLPLKKDLKEKIKCAKHYLQQIRVVLRDYEFESDEDEIHFFKTIKPSITGELRFFKHQLSYILEKPATSSECKEVYIRKKLEALNFFKRRNLQFYKYVKNDESHLDTIYFLRKNNQLELFDLSLTDLDSDTSTSHCLKLAKVVSHDYLVEYYKKELIDIGNEDVNKPDLIPIVWTESKANLVELIYALHNSGVFNQGNIEIKEISETFESFFNIDLGDVYRTFNDIKSRKVNQVRFLSKLQDSLQNKLFELEK
ncbi:RteC domain-containing protein [Algibacter mikhailovii]|uniref:RteC domain-containing protein n=1 Tax=Algibacter mikhailovii TaxID=425498 RepID=UPI0024946D7C|nr:RteC domain-containing protein [Algibacter mikhailovii]